MGVARGATGVTPMTALVTNPQSPSPPDLGPIVAAASRGDTEAFSALYDRYGKNVYNLVLRSTRHPQTAEDVCQEVWLKVYRELASLRDHAAFSTWLYRIAARASVDTARKRAVVVTTELPDSVAAPSHLAPDQAAIHHEQERLVWEALGALPPRQHLSLFLREVEGRNYREIAQIMNTSQSAIETLLFRARKGVAEAYVRLQGSRAERCGQARKAMAVLLDGEGTPVQRRALGAHVDGCSACRGEIDGLRRASAAYGVLPLLPVPAFLAQRIFEQLAPAALVAAGAGAGAGASAGFSTGGAAKLAALLAAKSKLFVATMTIGGGVTAGALLSPADMPVSARPPHAAVQLAAGLDAGVDAARDSQGLDAVLPVPAFGIFGDASLAADGPGSTLSSLESAAVAATEGALDKLERAVEQAVDKPAAPDDAADALPEVPGVADGLPDGGLPGVEPPLPLPPAPALPPTPPPHDVGAVVPDPLVSPPSLSPPTVP